jgi:signal transduction histidine kinase
MAGVLRALDRQPDLAILTGIRSGKRSYYSEFRRSNERLQKTVAVMDSISRAMVRTAEGPRALIEEVVRAAAEHLRATWMVIALADGALPDSRPRHLVVDVRGQMLDGLGRVPGAVRREVRLLRSAASRQDGESAGPVWVRVPMMLDGVPVGGLSGLHGLGDELDAADLSVLRILANQAAVSMHTSDLYQSGLSLGRRAQQLYDEVTQQTQVLAAQTEELRAAEQRLRAADQRELLDDERRRIALELHDSVAQTVLTAGIAVDVLAPEVASLEGGEDLAEQLDAAKALIVTATEQLRSVIYALHHSRTAEDVASLPELLHAMAAQHRPRLSVSLRVEGCPIPLGTSVEHSLARTAGEALFNVAMHAAASRAQVRLRYTPSSLMLRISDDGRGDPATLRRTFRLARDNPADGRHRGLVGMAARAEAIGGTLAIVRSRQGGVCIEVRVPIGNRSRTQDREVST